MLEDGMVVDDVMRFDTCCVIGMKVDRFSSLSCRVSRSNRVLRYERVERTIEFNQTYNIYLHILSYSEYRLSLVFIP
jgi:hypothetical protein